MPGTLLSEQAAFARHLFTQGYPLWNPDPVMLPESQQRIGLRIGDLGAVDERGRFHVFLNILDHPAPGSAGSPPDFLQIDANGIRRSCDDLQAREIVSSPETRWDVDELDVLTVANTTRRTTQYSATLSEEGAHIVLPQGAQLFEIEPHHRQLFEDYAREHGADWLECYKDRLRWVRSSSLHLLTGFYKTCTWRIGSFSMPTAATTDPEYVYCTTMEVDERIILEHSAWRPTGRFKRKIRPAPDRQGRDNQTVFIRGITITPNDSQQGRSERQSGILSMLSSPPWILDSLMGGSNKAASTETPESGVIIQNVPYISQASHPSEVINRYLLKNMPSAKFAVTDDGQWMEILGTFKERQQWTIEDLENHLEEFELERCSIVTSKGAVHLKNEKHVSQTRNDHGADESHSSSDKSVRATDPPTFIESQTTFITRIIFQNLVHTDSDGKLEVILYKMSDLNKDHTQLRTVVERNEGRPLGLSGAFLPNGTIRVLAIADATTVILISFTGGKKYRCGVNSSNSLLTTQGREYLRDHVLGRSCGFVYAFDMGPLALALWQSCNLRIRQAIDLQSAGPSTTRAPRATIALATDKFNKSNVIRTFENFICMKSRMATKTSTITPLAQRAWVAHYISQLDSMESRLSQVLPIDTYKLSDATLHFLAKSTTNSFQRDQLKPMEITHSYSTTFDHGKKQLHAGADHYQNKIRKGENQQVQIQVAASNDVGAFSVPAKIVSANSESAWFEATGFLAEKRVATITLMGREDLTPAEVKRAQIILMVLQGKISIDGPDSNPWIHKIYLNPREDFMWPAEWSQPVSSHVKVNSDKIPCPLNTSQRKAINCMLDQTDASRVTIIQGPPGTGKTTVIALYILTAISAGRSGIWLLAQSNIAVKNIAEKLAAFKLFDWRLLISDDFYVHWHEHLYHAIKANTITSGEFSKRHSELQDCPVVLCTLSMLSSNKLRNQGVFEKAPIHTVVVDEASQIEVGDYIPLFVNFTTIRKVVFIGDNMQLPPHGQSGIQDLQSVFELDHLIKQDTNCGKNPYVFLNTQYRMPPQIDLFIAETVYPLKDGNKNPKPLLKSSDHHPLANVGKSLLCHFVNVAGHQISQGSSQKNLEECKAIVQLAFIFQAQGKNFRIITPYDAQRSLIEEELKKAELKWEDKCFNVDSFQGNEEDYIIISLVRSRDLGFLSDKRRVNVMLSRCKRGMIIFTSKAYIEKYAGPGKSLIGELISSYYENAAWIEVGDLDKIQII